jgi:hypothetical protein
MNIKLKFVVFITMMPKLIIWVLFLIMHALMIVLYLVITLLIRWPIFLLNYIVVFIDKGFDVYQRWSSEIAKEWRNLK